MVELEIKYEDVVLIKKLKYVICFVMLLGIIKIFESVKIFILVFILRWFFLICNVFNLIIKFGSYILKVN